MSIPRNSRRALCAGAILAILTGCSSTGTLTYARPSSTPAGRVTVYSSNTRQNGAQRRPKAAHHPSRPQRALLRVTR
jgi:hypothetical protein